MKFKLPNLGKLVSSDKKLEDHAPQKLIHVIDGKALVSNRITAIVDIYEYVKKECRLENDDDFEMLKGIVEWMNGKSFTKDYWNELVKECYAVLTNEGIEIEYPSYNKTLAWEEIYSDKDLMIEVLRDNLLRKKNSLERTAVNTQLLTLLTDTFKKDLGRDSLMLEFSDGISVKFSGRSKDYIFGFMPLEYEAGNELTAFMNTNEFGDFLDKTLNQ